MARGVNELDMYEAMEIQILTDADSVDEFIKLVNYLKEIGYKQTLESSSINHYYSRLEIAMKNDSIN